MKILHDKSKSRFYLEQQGYTAYVGYEICGTTLNITTTQVPKPIGGQGIAAVLVKATYDYAIKEALQITSTCSYAEAWLARHAVEVS